MTHDTSFLEVLNRDPGWPGDLDAELLSTNLT